MREDDTTIASNRKIASFQWYQGYLAYLVVGGALGVVSWVLQIILKYALASVVVRGDVREGVSVVLAFLFIGIVGFLAHRHFVFYSRGSLAKFYLVSAVVILIVALLTSLIVFSFEQFGFQGFSIAAYPIAAILISPFSYLFKKMWVYRRHGA